MYVKKRHIVQENQKRYYLLLSLERRVIFTEKKKDFPFCIVRVNPALEMGIERLFWDESFVFSSRFYEE